RRWLHSLYPAAPVHLGRVPQDFRRPAFFMQVARAGLDRPAAAVDRWWAEIVIAYYAQSLDDALAVAGDLVSRLAAGSLIPLYDYSLEPEQPTGRHLRVQGSEVGPVEQDEGDQYVAEVRLRVAAPQAAAAAAGPEAPLITAVRQGGSVE
ncbi:MAG: hypothetical protein AB1816_18225, partial [Bacillota bacterium]